MEHNIIEKTSMNIRCFYWLWLIFCKPLFIQGEVHRIFCKIQKAYSEESDFTCLVEDKTEIHSKQKPDHASDIGEHTYLEMSAYLFPWAERGLFSHRNMKIKQNVSLSTCHAKPIWMPNFQIKYSII